MLGQRPKLLGEIPFGRNANVAKGDEDCTMRDGETSKEGGGLGSEDGIIQAPP